VIPGDEEVVSIMVDAVASRYPCVDLDGLADDPDVDDTAIGHIWEDQREALAALHRAGYRIEKG
jgi:hypothetical protein